MSKIAGIHQPNFIPWVGYFYKIIKSDVFVFLDDVQYIKRSFINRNKIKTLGGEQYVRLPIHQKGKYKQSIIDCEIFEKEEAVRILLNTISVNYSKTKYFKDYFEELKTVLNKETDSLVEINISLIHWVLNIMEVSVICKKSSELKDINGESTERLISICKSVGADKYLSGFGGNKYQDKEMFDEASIELMITDFEHPVYFQLWGEFIPNLSIIDLIFNYGSYSKNIILNEKI
jgi:hypothetical protein